MRKGEGGGKTSFEARFDKGVSLSTTVSRKSLLFLGCLSVAVSAAEKPNVIFMLADDLGQRDLGCYGSTLYETPNLDRLAKEGARFTNGYAACPVCSPTRAAVQTGRWPQRTGITDYIGSPLKPELWKRNTILLPAPYSDRLAHEEITMAEMMKGAGLRDVFRWQVASRHGRLVSGRPRL
jgi:hypothetical protein